MRIEERAMSPDSAAAVPDVQHFLAQALAAVDDAVIIIDNEQRITYLNAKAAAQYAVREADVLGKSLSQLHHYQWLNPQDEQAASKALAQNGHWRGQNIHRLPDGRSLHVDSTVTALRDAAGRQIGLLAVIRDITAQKQAEAALRELQEWQRLALEGAHLGIWSVDLETGATIWDARCREIFGVGLDEPASSEKGFSIIHPEDRPSAEAAVKAATEPASDGRYEVEKRIVWPDGSLHWVATRGQVFFEDVGGVRIARRLAGIVMDVNERKEQETELLRANRRAQLAETAAHSFIYEWNPRTHKTVRSPGLYDVLGYHPEELEDSIDAWRSLIHPEDYEQVSSQGFAAMDSIRQYSLEYRLRHRDGHYIYVWDQAVADLGTDGQVERIVGITTDISARKQMEQDLRETQERFRLALEKAPLSFAHMDKDLRYTWVYNTHPDFHVEELIGKRDDEVRSNPGIEQFVQAKQRVLDSGQGERTEFTFPLSDGDHTYDITFEPLRTAAGNIMGLTTAALDITDRKQAEAELRRSTQQLQALSRSLQELNNTLEQRVAERTAELERSNRELDRFAYIASHDLKAPLRAIDNLSTWIAEDAADVLPPSAQMHLTKLRGRVKRLEILLDDLLLYSRAGRRRHTPEQVNTQMLINGVMELLNPPPGFQVHIESDLPTIRSERPPLEIIIRNLLENAIKHHHRVQEGVVQITARPRDNMVEFQVADNGPGIEAQYHERIFEVFQTLRPRDEVEGSGMGLAIVKKTVESAGGKIWVESSPGAGTRFYFTWPTE